MRYQVRKLATIILVVAALAVWFFGLSQSALAGHKPNHKPGDGGDGKGTGGGIIYFRVVGLNTMNSDGSNKTPLPEGVDGEPSRELHGGHRWFLELRDIPGESYPANTFGDQRRELFALRDDGDEAFTVQLTTQPDLEPIFSVRWAPDAVFNPPLDDGLVSWVARRWDLGAGKVLEGGIYTAEILFDADGNVVGLVQQPSSPRLALPLREEFDGTLSPNVEYHDWSPDGTEIVYNDLTSYTIFTANLDSGQSSELTAFGRDPNWSPAGTLIAFHTGASIKTISPDGTNEKTIARLPRAAYSNAVLDRPRFSPTGSHLIYRRLDPASLEKNAIYRVTADGGGGKTDLTSDIEFGGEPVGWR